mmetsp:Transcript_32423/g.72808  ORF Transcript_32423/g.72808 Transcript_32423/m.72808 type:complete len:346 (-) Transcript_32423:413-1450(-)
MDWRKQSSDSEKSRASMASARKPVVRLNVLVLSLAFFIFLVSLDCLLLSICDRNSFNLAPSGRGSRPVMNLLMSLSQYAVSSFVHRPVLSSGVWIVAPSTLASSAAATTPPCPSFILAFFLARPFFHPAFAPSSAALLASSISPKSIASSSRGVLCIMPDACPPDAAWHELKHCGFGQPRSGTGAHRTWRRQEHPITLRSQLGWPQRVQGMWDMDGPAGTALACCCGWRDAAPTTCCCCCCGMYCCCCMPCWSKNCCATPFPCCCCCRDAASAAFVADWLTAAAAARSSSACRPPPPTWFAPGWAYDILHLPFSDVVGGALGWLVSWTVIVFSLLFVDGAILGKK